MRLAQFKDANGAEGNILRYILWTELPGLGVKDKEERRTKEDSRFLPKVTKRRL